MLHFDLKNSGILPVMKNEVGMDNDREVVTTILGLPPERIEYLHTKKDMPFDDEGFSQWFVANAALVLSELKEFGPIARWKKSQPEPVPIRLPEGASAKTG
jgi:hypothetical protein